MFNRSRERGVSHVCGMHVAHAHTCDASRIYERWCKIYLFFIVCFLNCFKTIGPILTKIISVTDQKNYKKYELDHFFSPVYIYIYIVFKK